MELAKKIEQRLKEMVVAPDSDKELVDAVQSLQAKNQRLEEAINNILKTFDEGWNEEDDSYWEQYLTPAN